MAAGKHGDVGGTKLRGLVLGVAILAALLLAGCAKKEPSVARIEGSEPQRLSFGPPQTVQRVFAEKVKLCWLEGPGALLAGYRFDLTPAVLDTGDGQLQLEQITLYRGSGSEAQVFRVHFHGFNDNTLIATRNQGFPPALAEQMKRDLETWILEREGCGVADGISAKDAGLAAGAAPAPAPKRSGWW
jgi:hypothetical protein